MGWRKGERNGEGEGALVKFRGSSLEKAGSAYDCTECMLLSNSHLHSRRPSSDSQELSQVLTGGHASNRKARDPDNLAEKKEPGGNEICKGHLKRTSKGPGNHLKK